MKNIKNFKQFESVEHSLIRYRFIIADMIEDSSLEDEDFTPQFKSSAVSFCRQGRPSESYLQEIVKKLEDSGVDTSELYK
jgi:hypothetical protein